MFCPERARLNAPYSNLCLCEVAATSVGALVAIQFSKFLLDCVGRSVKYLAPIQFRIGYPAIAWLQKVSNLVNVVAAPAIASGTPDSEYKFTIVISTAPMGRPEVTVSTVTAIQ